MTPNISIIFLAAYVNPNSGLIVASYNTASIKLRSLAEEEQ